MSDQLDRLEERFEALLESHGSKSDLGALRRKYQPVYSSVGVLDVDASVQRMVAFAQLTGFTPYDKQQEMARSYFTNKKTCVKGAFGVGKDAMLGLFAAYAGLVEGKLVLCLSATDNQLLTQFWVEVRRRFPKSFPGEMYTRDLRINREKRIVAMTAGAGSVAQLTGFHDPAGVVVLISESQAEAIGDAPFDAAIGNASGENCKIVVVGNPWKVETRFGQCFGKQGWSPITISAFDHPNVQQRREVIKGGVSWNFPEEARIEYGGTTDSAFYIAYVLAEFPSVSTEILYPTPWVLRGFENEELGKFPIDKYAEPPIISADIARFGSNSTVFMAFWGKRASKALSFVHSDTVATTQRLIEYAKEHISIRNHLLHKRPRLVIDESGIGGSCVDQARRVEELDKIPWRVIGFNGGSAATGKPDRFADQRSESFWHVRKLLETGNLAIPRDDRLLKEFAAMEYSIESNGKIRVIGKDVLRRKLKGKSIDFLDCLSMGLTYSVPLPSRGFAGTLKWMSGGGSRPFRPGESGYQAPRPGAYDISE